PRSLTLNSPDALQLQLRQLDSIPCFGDSTASLVALVQNAQGPLQYTWFNTTATADTARGLPSGNYRLLVTDSFGCSATDSIAVAQPQLLNLICQASAESASGANDGSIVLTLAGEGLLQLTGAFSRPNVLANAGPLTFNNLSPGTYDFVLTDANGCSDNCSVTVNTGGCNFTVVLDAAQPNCNTSTGQLTAILSNGSPNYSYQWTGNTSSTDSTATNLSPGDYSLLVTDGLGCSASAIATIQAFTDFPSLVVTPGDTICADACASFRLSSSGPPPLLGGV
ncbi:MAG: hypothetical protein HC821_03405, partial [Lewinella sp.]|nr:hypothetical protein [Lewinella sp.]